MKFDENLAAVHAYLCADGYVIKNPPTQKHKYYIMGLRNTNLTLLRDFQDRFEKVFGIKPYLIEGQRCRLGSKEIYEKLTNEFGSFYSWEWRMPKLNENLLKIWLRAYFDCEGWVTCKHHQNRHIGADCVNETGIYQVRDSLKKLGISCKVTKRSKRDIYSLYIYGKENISNFKDKIGFLHPSKKQKLDLIINDFMDYYWKFPTKRNKQKEFVRGLLKKKAVIGKSNGVVRIFSNKEENLIKLRKTLNNLYNLESRIGRRRNGIGTIYFELNVNKQREVKRLISHNLLSNRERLKWLKSRKSMILRGK